MEKVGILFGSSGGTTETVAKTIANKIGKENVDVLDVSGVSPDDAGKYKNLILGTSTWGVGDLQDDWESFLPGFSKISLEGKVVALFGLGDSQSYPDSFVDGIGTIYEEIKDKGVTIVGEVATDGYSYDDSKAVYEGKFVGLPLDEDNESDKTESRVEAWLEQVLPRFN